MNYMIRDKVKRCVLMFFSLLLLTFSTAIYACGDNPNAIIHGPFKDKSFFDGRVCFQNTPDKRNIDFYLSFNKNGEKYSSKVDTFFYSDAPVELMSVFFTPVNGVRNIVVLLRWHVNYKNNDTEYSYYYEVKTYKAIKGEGYVKNLDGDKEPELSGYQTKNNGKITKFLLDDAAKIKKFLHDKYGE